MTVHNLLMCSAITLDATSVIALSVSGTLHAASGAVGPGAVTGPGLVRATWPVSGRPLWHAVSRRDGEDLHRAVLRRDAAHFEKAPTTHNLGTLNH